ncbi:hypothetical protein NHQ30_006316 [Ciborinia camelliae]|nr:hypothetical protein NHQ30_006316 [Ciborinia camelliae]
MAEIGAIASGMGVTSLGLQLLDGIRKLKQFWGEVKDAPEDMRYALEQLETLSLVLSDIHTDDPDLPLIPSATATKCLELCRRGADMLSTVVKDLNGAISKRRNIGGAKVVLKKDTIEKFRNRLRDAQYMLMLSRQTYSEALQIEHHKIQIETSQRNAHHQRQELQELKVSIASSIELLIPLGVPRGMMSSQAVARDDDFRDDETKRTIKGRTRSKTHKQIQRFQRKLKLPHWFPHTGYTWDFSGFQAPSGWTFKFRQYYTLDYLSPAIRCVENGDLTGLQGLLQSKKATPFDRMSSDIPLLYTASVNGQYNMCRFLLDQGADPNDSSWGSALLYCVHRSRTVIRCLYPSGILRLLCPVSEIHNPFSDFLDSNVLYEELVWLLDNTDPTWRKWSFEDRMMFALQWSGRSTYGIRSCADILSLMLQQDQLSEACCRMTVDVYCSESPKPAFLSIELRFMAYEIWSCLVKSGEPVVYSDSTQSRAGKSDFERGGRLSEVRWSKSIQLIERLIVTGSDVYCGGLLFSVLDPISVIYYDMPIRLHELARSWILPVTVQLWLEMLSGLGIDLQRYGKVEHDEFVNRITEAPAHSGFSLEHPALECGYPGFLGDIHLTSFTYGPTIDDWKFWYTLDGPYWDYYWNFRHFWELVDHPEREMPGAWVEDHYWDWGE